MSLACLRRVTLLTIKASRPKVAFAKPTEVFFAITLTPPRIDSAQRAPLALTLSLDNSGSMAESVGLEGVRHKLDLAKLSAKKLVENLTDADTLGMVTFESYVRTVFEPMRMTAENKRAAVSRIDEIRSHNSTALCDGLLCSVEQTAANLSAAPNALRRIMLFTDGHANVGAASPEAILRFLRQRTASLRYKIGISTFGFGSNHNETLLRGILQDGAYYFIADPEKLPVAFGTELGGLISTYATDVNLNVVAGPGIDTFEILNDLPVDFSSSRAQVSCHNLLSEQPYTVIVKALTKKVPKGGYTLPTLEVSATLRDLRLNTTISVKADAKLEFVYVKNASKKDDAATMKLVAVQIAEKAQRDAMAAANTGDIAGAQTVLRTAGQHTYSMGATTLSGLLNSQVHDGFASISDYKSKGGKVSASLSNSLSRQTAGTGGAVQGGVDIDEMLGNESQKTMAKTFSIKRAPRKTDSV